MKHKILFISSLILAFSFVVFYAEPLFASEYEVVECNSASDCDAVTCKTAACTSNACVYTDIAGCGETPTPPGGTTIITGGGGGGGIVVPIPSPNVTPTPGASPLSAPGPVISQIQETVKSNSSAITWKTDKGSVSWLIYGEGATYQKQIRITGYRTDHLITIANLSPNKDYHYMIVSSDSSNNIGFSLEKKFKTKEQVVIAPPAASVSASPSSTPIPAPAQKSNFFLNFFNKLWRLMTSIF